MKRSILLLLACLGVLNVLYGAPAPDASLLLWLPLDEGSGTLAVGSEKSVPRSRA